MEARGERQPSAREARQGGDGAHRQHPLDVLLLLLLLLRDARLPRGGPLGELHGDQLPQVQSLGARLLWDICAAICEVESWRLRHVGACNFPAWLKFKPWTEIMKFG